jgi:hypothetical protein
VKKLCWAQEALAARHEFENGIHWDRVTNLMSFSYPLTWTWTFERFKFPRQILISIFDERKATSGQNCGSKKKDMTKSCAGARQICSWSGVSHRV